MSVAGSDVIPTVVTRVVVAEELPAVLAWAARRPGWTVEFDDPALHLNVKTTHPVSGTPLRIQADLQGYRAVPPAWRFLHPDTDGEKTATDPFPQPGTHPLITGSIFHGNRVICAPWNRLAYKENGDGGVHGDWGGLTNWTDAAAGYTKADTLADMLSQIGLHLSVSPGMCP
jgi:hypothetical protein